MYYSVLVAGQGFRGDGALTYAHPENLKVGQIVSVPLQHKAVVGIVKARANKPGFATKQILSVRPLFVPEKSMKLIEWLADYYPSPLGSIVELFTPPALPKIVDPAPALNFDELGLLPKLTPEQAEVIQKIESSPQKSILIHGDTATGKTRVYLELVLRCLQAGRSAIVITPEIGLTEPLLETFRAAFGNRVVITHSNMTPAERRKVWIQSSQSDDGLVVLGPRSAVFSPLKNTGLIVIDEAHDTAFKQEQAPRYQTTRVAAQLARLHNATFVMGSATPLVSDYFTFKSKELPILRMTLPAITTQTQTTVSLVDLREKDSFSKSAWLSNGLVAAMSEAMKRKEQSLIFLNRRGSARLVLCENCGWQALCPNCDSALTYHHDSHSMRCHSCDFSGEVPSSCPDCGENELVFRSIGTKALETELARLFPAAKISRFDRDTKAEHQLSKQYQSIKEGHVDIIIGTQTIAKGFDLPKLSVAGVIQADSGLQIPDYTANERTFQLISQVSGRVGRGHLPGQLFIQSYRPDSPLIKQAITKDYLAFYEAELQQRKQFNFPPYTHILKITASRASSKSALKACQDFQKRLSNTSGLIVEGPSPRFIEKKSGKYAWHLIVKSPTRGALVKIIKESGNYIFDLDPSDLL